MKVITLHQPWASLIAIGEKPFETRSWAPPASLIGRPIAIHAAARKVRAEGITRPIFEAFAPHLPGQMLMTQILTLLEGLPLGAVVCTAILAAAYQCGDEISPGQVEVVKAISRGDDFVTLTIDPFGDFSPGRWAWHLEDIRPFPKPIPAKGHQGFWNWTPTILATTGESTHAIESC